MAEVTKQKPYLVVARLPPEGGLLGPVQIWVAMCDSDESAVAAVHQSPRHLIGRTRAATAGTPGRS